MQKAYPPQDFLLPSVQAAVPPNWSLRGSHTLVVLPHRRNAHAGYDFVISKVTLNYKSPLRSRDEFRSQLRVTREGIKYVFHQEIIRLADDKVCLKGTVESVCVHEGKLTRTTPYDNILEGHLDNQ